ncbi:MAG: DUF6323 family protein [Eubacteriaceae bacterium]
MNNKFTLIPSFIIEKSSINKLICCNELTSRYGLTLSQEDALELVKTHSHSLKNNGRVEFGNKIIEKLIFEFCDSPFISQFNYSSTLNELIEIFYYFKNETLDEISDDELLSLMKDYFDTTCGGSTELLQNRELETLAQNIRFGIKKYADVSENYYNYLDAEDYDG